MSNKIIIDGNIGSGKSTVIKSLQGKYLCIEEPIEEWKPYLEAFYKDMNKNSLLFQMKVLQHHMLNKMYLKDEKITIFERSSLSCINIFGKNLLETGYLSELDIQLMEMMNILFGWAPSKVIYINTPPDICYERIHERSRENEIIPKSYLESIAKLYDDLYIRKCMKLYINKVWIVDGSQTKEKVLEDIEEIIKQNF